MFVLTFSIPSLSLFLRRQQAPPALRLRELMSPIIPGLLWVVGPDQVLPALEDTVRTRGGHHETCEVTPPFRNVDK